MPNRHNASIAIIYAFHDKTIIVAYQFFYHHRALLFIDMLIYNNLSTQKLLSILDSIIHKLLQLILI